jgi:hypothetical protein
MIEGGERAYRRDLEAKASARRGVANRKLYYLALGMPQKQDFVHPAQPLR